MKRVRGRRLITLACLAAVFIGLLYSDKLRKAPEPPPKRPAPPGNLAEVYRSLPARDQGRLERDADPLNMLFWGTEGQVVGALTGTIWTSLPVPYPECFRLGIGQLLRGESLTLFPPMNPYKVMGRLQDLNFVIVIEPVLTRHHFRLWRTGWTDAEGRELWWGTGNYDLSVRLRDLSHRPDPDMNFERDYVAKTLEKSPFVQSMERVALPQIPLKGVNDKGYPFKTDGRALVVTLGNPVSDPGE